MNMLLLHLDWITLASLSPHWGKVLRHAGIPEDDGAHFEHILNVAYYAISWLESVMRKAGCFGRWHLRNNDKHDVQLAHPYPDRVHFFRCLLLSFKETFVCVTSFLRGWWQWQKGKPYICFATRSQILTIFAYLPGCVWFVYPFNFTYCCHCAEHRGLLREMPHCYTCWHKRICCCAYYVKHISTCVGVLSLLQLYAQKWCARSLNMMACSTPKWSISYCLASGTYKKQEFLDWHTMQAMIGVSWFMSMFLIMRWLEESQEEDSRRH